MKADRDSGVFAPPQAPRDLRRRSISRAALDWAFFRSFDGLVYNQVWEDPVVDLKALALRQGQRIVMIGSAGCNALAYMSQPLARIDTVDVNAAHRAVFDLKRTAMRHLPDHDSFFRLFGEGKSRENVADFDKHIAPHLPPDSRAYWESKRIGLGRQINMFQRGYYRHGILARFVGLIHRIARLRGSDLSEITRARDLSMQRAFFNRHVAPLFDARLTHFLAKSPASLFALGIPPAQHARMTGASKEDIAALMRDRIERLACDFPIAENPFAWQIFARRYGPGNSQAIPTYLTNEAWHKMRAFDGALTNHATDLVSYLKSQPAGSVHRFNLLDSQDWMPPEVIQDLWKEITRTACADDARVLFRTAGTADAFYDLPTALKSGWQADAALGARLSAEERTGLYSGVHVIVRNEGP
jgi:S-adenosylmethionine-diacylglycerol 3-amino-3-carboxypropyl transferase